MAQISANVQSELTGQEAGLVGLFRFDDNGATVENFARSQDWLTGWFNAAQLQGGATVEESTVLPVNDADTDNDGIADWWEIQYFGNTTTANRNSDADGDGLYDRYEFLAGTNPLKQQTLPGTPDADADPDLDGLSNAQEQLYSTHPNLEDSDDDGVLDGAEVTAGADPNDPYSPLLNRALNLTAAGAFAQVNGFAASRLDPTRPLTVELWYQLDAASALSGALLRKTALKDGMPVADDFWFGLDNGTLVFKYRAVDGSVSEARFDDLPLTLAGEWIHAAAILEPARTASFDQNTANVTFVVQIEGYEYSATVETAGARDPEATDGALVFGPRRRCHVWPPLDEVRVWQTRQTDLKTMSACYPDAIRENALCSDRRRRRLEPAGRVLSLDDEGASPKTPPGRSFDNSRPYRTGAELAALTLTAPAAVITLPSDQYGDATFAYLRADVDGDAIPDFWENKHFASLNAAASDEAGRAAVDGAAWWTDADDDGVNDYYEFMMGFNPVNSDDSAQLAVAVTSGLTLAQAQYWRVNPLLADTDDDGAADAKSPTGTPQRQPTISI